MDVFLFIAASLLLTAGLSPLLATYADKLNLLDVPLGRKQHHQPTPLIGGLAMWLAFTVLGVFNLPASTETYNLLGALSMLMLLGLVDDRHTLSAGTKFVLQTGIALLLIFGAGCHLNSLGNLLGIGELHLGWLSYPLSLFAILSIFNAVNMLDGLDGLAGLTTLAPLLILAFFSLFSQADGHASLLILILAIGVLLGFLWHNFPKFGTKPAKVFMGDAGSLFLGGLVAWVSIYLSQGTTALVRPVAMLWLFIIPLFDLLTVVILRLRERVHPTTPGRDHLHHALLDQGYSPKQAVLLLAFAASVAGVVAIAGELLHLPEVFMFVAFIVSYLSFLFWRLGLLSRSA